MSMIGVQVDDPWASSAAARSGLIGRQADAALDGAPLMAWSLGGPCDRGIDEGQVLACADLMRDRLSAFGYDLLMLDSRWFADADGVAIDRHGRPAPIAARFPSGAEGRGLAPLAEQLRKRGLRLGVYLDRGLPRAAAARRAPILGAAGRTASDIADLRAGPGDMLSVDNFHPAAQAYYDSLLTLLSGWGVAVVKLGGWRPSSTHDLAELAAMTRAAHACEPPMALCLSPPGRTERADEPAWSRWVAIDSQFDRLAAAALGGGDRWPSTAAALARGLDDLGCDRPRLSRDEQKALMTLWAIARAPLSVGGDLARLDAWTLSLLTNDAVLAVNQRGVAARPMFDRGGLTAWTSVSSCGRVRYLALFNRTGAPQIPSLPVSAWAELGSGVARELWSGETGRLEALLNRTMPAHGARLFGLQAPA